MHLTDEDRNTYNDIRPVFIGACPECGTEIDHDDNELFIAGDSENFPVNIVTGWACRNCGRVILIDEAYVI